MGMARVKTVLLSSAEQPESRAEGKADRDNRSLTVR